MKTGDTVVCINDNNNFTLHKFCKYTILTIWQTSSNNNSYIKINNKTSRGYIDGNLYHIKDFISLKEYRKIKIQNLCLK